MAILYPFQRGAVGGVFRSQLMLFIIILQPYRSISLMLYFKLIQFLTSSVLVAGRLEFRDVYVEFGENLGKQIPSDVLSLISQTGVNVFNFERDTAHLTPGALLLSLGNASASRDAISLAEVGPEGFRVVGKPYEQGSILIAADGKPIDPRGFNYALDVDEVHYGAAAASFAVLELLGFSFIHPMDPFVPNTISLEETELELDESPYWTSRTWHIHTQHPLEFTEVLNGFDIPMFVKEEEDRECGRTIHCEKWSDMFQTLNGLFQWLLANKQNRVEVLLLGNEKWDKYNNLTSGEVRKQRLRDINVLAHSYGILMGADIPLANLQQHGWAMISLRDSSEKQKQSIESRVDWAFDAQYDFISTESGLSEFTKPTCDEMLNLFEIFTERVHGVWQREALTKVHCSTDQYCEDVDDSGALKYPDPRTGEAINFNFLPTYASSPLSVMPHTIQVYGFEDPTAGAYGNENFEYMFDYLSYEGSVGKRDVLYYGETAYWVNVDVDVPLFLPLSGQRRLVDMRKIAQSEISGGYKIAGQMNFESGWEFGYSLSNAIAARAAWNPQLHLADEWEAFEGMLRPMLTNLFGPYTQSVLDAIISLSKVQVDVFVFGKVLGTEPEDLSKLSGHAYMSGSDTWVDLPRMLGMSLTQPDKIHLDECSDPQWSSMLKLVNELHRVLLTSAKQFQDVLSASSSELSDGAYSYLEELTDSVTLLSLRAEHAKTLYAFKDESCIEKINDVPSHLETLITKGRSLLHEASQVMDRRVLKFRVPSERIAGWRQGPTVYPYGYVWAAKSLYFLWRDQGIVEQKSLLSSSPCYLNRIEPIELVFGWGKLVEETLRLMLKKRGIEANETMISDMLADCLAPPLHEFKFPRDL